MTREEGTINERMDTSLVREPGSSVANGAASGDVTIEGNRPVDPA